MKRRILVLSVVPLLGIMALFMMLVVSSASAEGGYPIGYGDDRAQIEDLLARYMFAMDFNDAEGFAALFTEDCMFIPKQGKDPLNSRDAIIKDNQNRAKRYIPKPDATEKDKVWPPASRHFLSSLVLRIEGDKGYGSAYYIHFRNAEDDRLPDGVGYGHYTDEYRKVDGRWYISYRKWSNETREQTHTTAEGVFINPAVKPY